MSLCCDGEDLIIDKWEISAWHDELVLSVRSHGLRPRSLPRDELYLRKNLRFFSISNQFDFWYDDKMCACALRAMHFYIIAMLNEKTKFQNWFSDAHDKNHWYSLIHSDIRLIVAPSARDSCVCVCMSVISYIGLFIWLFKKNWFSI